MLEDVWAVFGALVAAMQARHAKVPDTRGTDLRRPVIRRACLADVAFPANARVLEVGRGTGVLTRAVARLPGIWSVAGVDPAPSLLARTRDLAGDLSNVAIQRADGRSPPFDAADFDVVISDSTLSHKPGPERALGKVRASPGCPGHLLVGQVLDDADLDEFTRGTPRQSVGQGRAGGFWFSATGQVPHLAGNERRRDRPTTPRSATERGIDPTKRTVHP